MNQELVSYVKGLTLDDDNDDSHVVEQFIDKLQEPVEYKHLLRNFKWNKEHYTLLDDKLIELGYRSQTDAISEIKQFLINKLYKMPACEYNLVFREYNANLWNHMEYIEIKCNDFKDDEVAWMGLSWNSIAIKILEKNPDKIEWICAAENPKIGNLLEIKTRNAYDEIYSDKPTKSGIWEHLSANPGIIDFISRNLQRVHWSSLQKNSAAVEIIKRTLARTDVIYPICDNLSLNTNPEAIEILKKKPDEIDWHYLSLNPCPAAIELLRANPTKINWRNLSYNPSAIDLLAQNLDNVNWYHLSSNYKAIDLLKANPDKIDWNYLSYNSGAIDLLKNNPDKINLDDLCSNPYDFNQDKFDYFNKMRLFPRSGLVLKNPHPPNYDKIYSWLPRRAFH